MSSEIEETRFGDLAKRIACQAVEVSLNYDHAIPRLNDQEYVALLGRWNEAIRKGEAYDGTEGAITFRILLLDPTQTEKNIYRRVAKKEVSKVAHVILWITGSKITLLHRIITFDGYDLSETARLSWPNGNGHHNNGNGTGQK